MRRAWLAYAAPPLAIWSVWWAALFPGIVSPDPLHELATLAAGRPDDWHPIAHALLLYATVKLSGSFGLLTALHVVLTAALAGALLATAARLGAPRWACAAASIALALVPTYGGQVVAAWKDTAFGIAVLGAVLALARGLEEGRLGRARAVGLGLALAAVWLFRHPGLLVAGTLLAGAAWLFPRERREVGVAAALCVGLALAVAFPLKAALRVPPPPPLLAYHSVLHDLAAQVAAGTPLPEGDQAALAAVLPLDTWRARYDCRGSLPILFDPALSTARLEEAAPRLVPLWLRLARDRPGVLLRHRACVTAFLWDPAAVAHIGPVGPGGASVAGNALGIANRSLLPRVAGWLADTKWRLENSPWRTVLFAPATFLYVLLAACAAGVARTRSRLLAVVAAAALVNTGTYLLLASTPEVRFQWPVTLLAPIAVTLALAAPRAPGPAGRARGGREDRPLASVPCGEARG